MRRQGLAHPYLRFGIFAFDTGHHPASGRSVDYVCHTALFQFRNSFRRFRIGSVQNRIPALRFLCPFRNHTARRCSMQDVIYLFGPYANLLNQFWGDSLLRPDPIEIDLVAELR